jgi:hypothetical protein
MRHNKSAFQKWALAAYADQQVTDYVRLSSILTRTDFETCRAYANWSTTVGSTVGGHAIPAEGALVACDNGSLTAGVFTRYNNVALSPGDHYLIETRGAWGTIVRRPIGLDTDLTVARLPAWSTGGPARAYAMSASGQVIGSTPVTAGVAGLTFRWARSVAGQTAAAYWLPNPQVYLPLVVR